MKSVVALAVGVVACGFLIAAAADAPKPADPKAKPKAFKSVETKDLHNAHVVTDKVISGAAPENDQAFKDLQALGVKTIISVDGAQPDAEAAKKYGMRYVHIPMSYRTVEKGQAAGLAKAINELPGPMYIHCHHGKHRSAAAVAVGCIMAGQLKPEQGEKVLETFGTGENYTGLWKISRETKPLSKDELANLKADFVEHAKIAAFAEHMVAVDMHWDHLKSIQKNKWKAPADHPDLEPAHEALQLQEHLRESARLQDSAKRPEKFREILTDSEAGAEALHKALAAKPVDEAAAEAAFKRVANTCTACHKPYRD